MELEFTIISKIHSKAQWFGQLNLQLGKMYQGFLSIRPRMMIGTSRNGQNLRDIDVH